MIEIYLKTNTNYDKNGDITLDPTSCTYKESEKELTLEHFLDEDGRWKYINFENVIAAEENGKKKFYRIYNVVRELYSVTAYARPIFYDLIDKVLLDVRPTNKIGQEALDIILADTGFTGHSNISTSNTAYYVRKNIVEALLGDEENSFINRWGGEFYCENFDVYINDRIGADNGVRVEFGYNLNEIEEDVNIEEVVTRIIPTGYDGIMLDGETPWVDSPLINKYTQPKMRVIEFSDVKVKESSDDEEGFDTIEEARAELIRQCNLLYENDIDKPTVNYKIDMINLANTTAYKDFKMLVEVNKGDTVTCYIKHLDIDVKARVIDYERDLITGEYTSIELGNAVSNFFNKQADIQSQVDNILNDNGSVNAGTVEGAINAIKTQFKALKDIAQPQDVRAIIFEDRVEDSPTFGCMCLGTMGFEIASSFKPGTKEWDFKTFGTGQGFYADYIVAGELNASLIKTGVLMSANGQTWIDMNNGSFNFANNLTMDEEGNIVYKGTITGSYADLRDTLLINGKGGNGWAQILLRSSTGLEGNIYTGGEKSLNMFAPSGIYIGGYRAVLEDKDDKWKMWTTDGGKGKAIFFDAVNGKIYSEGMPLTLSALGGRVQTETNFYVKGSCNPISHATGGMDLGASNLRWYTLYCVTAINTSDKRYKKNIKYLDEDNRVPVSNFSSRTSSVNKDEYKYYDFIKNELKLAEYDYDRQDSTYRVEDHQIGFIAQDIINTEIGEKFCYELEEGLGFSATGYTSIIAKALQEAIQKIESLEKEIELLKTQQ